MKWPIKIIKYADGKYGAKKKGWFGWKYLSTGDLSNGWNYFGQSDRWTFDSPQAVLESLQCYYHSDRKKNEYSVISTKEILHEEETKVIENKRW